mgnify:CR=1 FL=1
MKKVLVTGATGSIGEAIVKEYAKNGYFVYIHYNSNKEKAHALLEEINAQGELICFAPSSFLGIANIDIQNEGITKGRDVAPL